MRHISEPTDNLNLDMEPLSFPLHHFCIRAFFELLQTYFYTDFDFRFDGRMWALNCISSWLLFNKNIPNIRFLID